MPDIEKTLLITGVSGLVGGNAAVLSKSRFRTVAAYGKNAVSIPGVSPVPLDLEDGKAIRKLIQTVRPDAILHCAARSNMDDSESNRDETFRINADSVRIFAEACAETGIRLVFTSTDMVFDGEKGHYSETDAVNPISIYGESKCTAEEQIRSICPNHVIARVALVYGKPATGGVSFSGKILQTWREGKRATLFTDQYRTPIEVGNLAEALLELVDSALIGTLHLGGSERVDRYTFGLHLAELKGVSRDRILPIRMEELPSPAKRPRDASFDISKARSLLRTSLLGFREGLAKA